MVFTLLISRLLEFPWMGAPRDYARFGTRSVGTPAAAPRGAFAPGGVGSRPARPARALYKTPLPTL